MKKKISLILAFLMAATMMAGCKRTDDEASGLPEAATTTSMPEPTQMTMEETTTAIPEITTTEETTEVTEDTAVSESETEETTSVSEETTASETTTAAETSVAETASATEAKPTEWSETEISETLYIQTSCYSRVKAVVGSESVKKYEKGTKINIVAATDTGYYKLADGTFIHSDYVTDVEPVKTEVVTTAKKENNKKDDDDYKEEKPSSSSKPISSSYNKSYEDRYAYQQLSSSEQELYAAIVEAAENFDTEMFEIPAGFGSDEVFKVYAVVYNQEPQLFWLSPSAPRPLGGMLGLEYDVSRDEAEYIQEEIDANVKDIMSKVGGYSGTVSRIKVIYDWVITHNTFSLSGSYATCGIYNGLTDGGELQCQGYAKTFQYLCDVAGIESMVVVGNNTEGSTHAWNIVYCDNGYYIVDTTWGDPQNSYGKSSYVRYLFFLANDEMIENTHLNPSTILRSSTGERFKLFDLPSCTKTACYYFNAYNKVYDNEKDAEKGMYAEIEAAVKAGKNVAHIQVSDHDLWETMRANSYWKKYQNYAKELSDDVKELKRQTTLTEDVLVVQFDIVYE